MKASLKLREDDDLNPKPPLLRAKFPVSAAFNLPVAASLAAGGPSDLSFHLHLLSSPSLKLSFRPFPNPNPSTNYFSLTLKSPIPYFPGRLSLRLCPNPNPSFSLHIKPQLGHFSVSKSESLRAVHGVGAKVSTAVPVGRGAGVRVRWAVRVPEEVKGKGLSLPCLRLDKITVERVNEEEEEEADNAKREWSEKDVEGMRGMCYWMEREVEEMRREREEVKEGVEAVWKRVSEWQKDGRKQVGIASSGVAGGRRM